MIRIRPARLSEAAELATLHVDTWRKTYRDLAPPKALAKLDVAHRLPVWRKTLSPAGSSKHTLVAVKDKKIAGLISFGSPTNPAFGDSAEIKHLYVDPSNKRQAVGRRLMVAAFDQLMQDGFQSAALAVVRGNDAALKFYFALGGVQMGCFTDAGPIWKSDNNIIKWDPVEIS